MKILILQHPKETKRPHGTASLIQEFFPEARIKTGLSWRNLNHAWENREDRIPAGSPANWLVLYMGAKQPKVPGESLQYFPPGKKTALSPNIPLPRIDGLILLDGNFSEAKTLWWRNPWLLRLWKGSLHSAYRSQYAPLRKAARKEGYSSFEALVLALSLIEKVPAIREEGLLKMKAFVESRS